MLDNGQNDSGAPQGYAKDKQQLYFHNGEIKGVLPDTFSVATPFDAPPLADHLARDKHHFYHNDEIVEEAQWLEMLLEMTQVR